MSTQHCTAGENFKPLSPTEMGLNPVSTTEEPRTSASFSFFVCKIGMIMICFLWKVRERHMKSQRRERERERGERVYLQQWQVGTRCFWGPAANLVSLRGCAHVCVLFIKNQFY